MARLSRQFSNSGLYHVVFRGVNKQHIFEEDTDYQKFLDSLQVLKGAHCFEIYAYCLMSNHVHILLKEKNLGDISLIMKSLLSKYARWYNTKYKRSGALIANRYKSQSVESDDYLLPLVRYIHQNPLRARIAENIAEYYWSSYCQYATDAEGIIDKCFVLGILGKKDFLEYHKILEFETFSVDDKKKMTDDAVRREVIKLYEIEPKQIGSFEKKERNRILAELKKRFSIRQLERITGVSRGVIDKS